jgi:uncharacterized RDD family membrane protein YckC
MTWITEPISATLAKRRTRFGAFTIDQAIGAAIFWFANHPSFSVVGGLLVVCLLLVNIVQIALLGTRGQTIGKMILKIVIVDHVDKTPPGFVRAALIRQVPLMLVNLFSPAFAIVYMILDGVPIFASSRRCLHDRFAGTIVIDVQSDLASPTV